jgi:hypothetical protein
MIPTLAAVALACGLLERTQLRACVIQFWCRGGAPAAAQTTRSAPAAEKLDIKTAPKDQLKTVPGIGDADSQKDHRRAPLSQQAGFGAQKHHCPGPSYDKIKEKIMAKQPKASGMAPASAK